MWDDKRSEIAKKKRQQRTSRRLAWALGALGSASAIYGYCQDIRFYNYSFFDGVAFLWNSDSTYALGKICAWLVFVSEAGFVILIAPVAIASDFFGLSSLVTEIALAAVLVFFLWISSREEDDDDSQLVTPLDFNLERLGFNPIYKKIQFEINKRTCFYIGRLTRIWQAFILTTSVKQSAGSD